MNDEHHHQSRNTPRGQPLFGVRAHVDGHFKTLYYPADDGALNAERFAAFRRSVALRNVTQISTTARALSALLAFDAPCLAELPAIYTALSRPYRFKEHVALEWENSQGAVDRRLLSPFTVLALNGCKGHRWPSFEQASADMVRAANLRSMDELLNAAGAWMLVHMPGWLLPRIYGTGRSVSLPRSALARWATGLCVASASRPPPLNPQVLELMDWSNAGAGDDGDVELFSRIAKACTALPHSARHKEIERMRTGLLGLAPQALEAGPMSSLMLWFALNLVEHGTRGTPELAPRTIQEYVRLTVPLAGRLLPGLQVCELSEETLTRFYRHVIADADEGQASKAHSACIALHGFLNEWHDAGPWPLSDTKAQPGKPQAQAVFRHERDRIWSALGEDDCSDPVHWRLKVIYAIHAASPRRKQDAAVIRVGDIRIYEGRVALDVDPNPLIDAKLKTQTSRVSVEIRDPRCVRVLLAARQHRRDEGAADSDKLLGTIDAPEVAWRFEACHAVFISVLKWATGEPEVSARSLRHAHLTEPQMDRDLSQREIDQLSASAGHASNTTTLDSYGHAFEFACKRAMDARLGDLDLPSAAIAGWTALTPATVRKAWSRSSASRATVTTSLLRTAAACVEFEDVAHGLLMGEPGDLDLPALYRARAHLSVEGVIRVLVDLCADELAFDAEQIAARHACSPAAVKSVEAAVHALLGRKRWEWARFNTPGVASVLEGAPMSIDLGRAAQPKSAALLRRLVRHDPHALCELAACWLRVARGDGYLCQDLGLLLPLLKVLRDAGTQPAQVVLAHDGSLENLAAIKTRLDALMGGSCAVELQSPRGGRARAYLQVTELGKRGRASRSVAGLNAVLLGLAVTQYIGGAQL